MVSGHTAAAVAWRMVRSYRELRVWQLGMDLVTDSYRLAEHLPKSEAYGLAAQIRRAAVSIPANIAEGHGREHLREYLQHLSIAYGSLVELETHMLIAERLGHTERSETESLLERTARLGRMLNALTRGLRTLPRRRRTPDT